MIGPRISGNMVNLRPVKDTDLIRRAKWLADEETVTHFTGIPPSVRYQLHDALKWRRGTECDPLTLVWAIETKQGEHIGDIDLHDIDRTEGRARLTILIGDAICRGKGYGTDALRALMGYAFTSMGLDAIDLKVCDFNLQAIRCYEKCGFEKLPSCLNVPGLHPGDIYMTVTKERVAALHSDGKVVYA